MNCGDKTFKKEYDRISALIKMQHTDTKVHVCYN